jgi:hypothetical protein
MKTEHTPGPWWVGPYYKSDVLSAQGTIAEAKPFNSPLAAVNAKLIAAAPDLLEACQDFVSKLDDYFAGRINIRPDYADRARAAIAKATSDKHPINEPQDQIND